MRTRAAVLFVVLIGFVALCAQVSGQQGLASRKPGVNALQALAKLRPDIEWDDKSVLVGDIACDGGSDQVYLGHTPGKMYVGFYRAINHKPQVLEFLVSGAYQNAVCSASAESALESQDCGFGQAEGCRPSKVCKGIELADGQCDPIHLFWNRKEKQLRWWRN